MGQELYSIRDVLDQVRTLLTRAHTWYGQNIEPLEKLPDALEAAARILDQELPAGKREVETLTHVLAGLRASKPDVEAEVAVAQARVQTAQDSAVAAERASGEKIRAAERLAEARETELVRDFEFKGATLQREHEAQREALALELAALESTKAKLIQEVAALREKFSKF